MKRVLRTQADTLVAATFLLSLCLWLFSYTLADPDLWGHLRFGQDLLASGTLARQDPYSFLTGGGEWINHEWLSELLFAALFSAGGAPALILVKVVLGLGLCMLAWRELARHDVPPVRALFPLIPMVGLMADHLATVRPQMFTLAALGLTVWAICRREEGSRLSLWLLPPVFALWANLHGGFLAGFGVLMVWLTVRVMTALRRGKMTGLRADALPVGTALLATLVNPYGIGLWLFLLRTATVPRPEIVEWQPLIVTSPYGLVYLLLLGITGGSLLADSSHRRPAMIAVFLCLAVLPFAAIRHLSLFAFGTVMVSAPSLASAGKRWLGVYHSPPTRLLLPAVGTAAVFLALSVPRIQTIPIDTTHFAVPARAMAALATTQSQARLAVPFNWGEYAIWHLGPRVQVSVDGRRETVYSDAAYRLNLRFAFGQGHWDELIDDAGADVALVERDSPPYNLLHLKPGWQLVYEDATVAIFAADSSPIGAELKLATPPDLPADGRGLTFP